MQGIGEGGIEFGAEADQTGRIGGGEFENAFEPGCRLEQVSSVARLAAGSAAAVRELGCGRIAERLQKKPDVGIFDVTRVIAEKP